MDESSLAKVVHSHCYVGHTFHQELVRLWLSLHIRIQSEHFPQQFCFLLTFKKLFRSPFGKNSITNAGERDPKKLLY